MKMPASVVALLALWPTLPQTLGREWPRTYWQLLDLLREFEGAADEESRAELSVRLLRRLRRLPGGVDALRQVHRGNLRLTRNGDLRLPAEGEPLAQGAPPDDPALAARLETLLRPPRVTRFTDVYAPSRAVVGERFPIIVGLTRAPADGGSDVAAIQARLNQLIRVVLTPRGPELLGEPAKDLRVSEEDSEPVVFYLRTVQSGAQSVLIDFYSQSYLLASVTHTLTAQEAGAVTLPGKLPARALELGDYQAPFPDLVLRVCTKDNRLTYTLHYHSTEERIIEGPLLRADPEQYRYQIIHEIENLAEGKDVDGYPLTDAPGKPLEPRDFLRRLEKIGQRLYNDLFEGAMQQEYPRLRAEVRTLEIVSDEPWIPWELIKPYDDDLNDDFFCLQYELSRWVSGGVSPAAEIAVDSLACIAPTDSGLIYAQEEQAALRALARQRGLIDRSPKVARRDLVEALLEGEAPVKLWHFACHGNFDARAPGNSPLVLQHTRLLRPNDLVGRAQSRLRADRPLVFLNACRVGQSGLSLTGLGGWAKKLVVDCRVGALIAPLWSVNDRAAQHFADMFYQAVGEPGMTLAAAVQQARRETQQAYPYDTTCLAYSFYAHPNARLQFVAGPRSGAPSAPS